VRSSGKSKYYKGKTKAVNVRCRVKEYRILDPATGAHQSPLLCYGIPLLAMLLKLFQTPISKNKIPNGCSGFLVRRHSSPTAHGKLVVRGKE
jgi:hypothetical protein